jgi:type II secretory pathway component GspD/PulD (secretin)
MRLLHQPGHDDERAYVAPAPTPQGNSTMSRHALLPIVGGLVLLFGLAACAAGDPPAKDDAAANKRIVYIVKHGSAKDLAAVLAEHFKGVADVQTLPDASSNSLLISAAPSAFDDVVKILAQLDRQPQTVAVEILIAEAACKKADGDKTAPADDVNEKDFTGPMADVEAKLEALHKKGVLSDLKRVQFTAVEGVPASLLLGESKPVVMGANTTATGLVSRMITYRDLGIKADATVHVSPEKVVSLDLKLEDARAVTPENAIQIGTDETGKPILATEFPKTTLTSKLDIPSGKAQAAEGVKISAKSDKTHVFVVVGARVVEADAKSDK